MASFIDTSALVKGYVSEPGSAWVVRLIQSDAISISELTLTEMGSALSRRVRERIMPAIQARTAWRRFRRDFRTFGVAVLNERALLDAAILASRSPVPLRTLDAIQLEAARRATRLARAAGLPEPVVITADGRMEAAAQALGFATDNPLNYI